MTSAVVYHQIGRDVAAVAPDPAATTLYRDLLLVHRLNDVFGHVPADEDALLLTGGEVFYSSSGVYGPEDAHNFTVGSSDGQNGCWSPDPRNAAPEYVGVRFTGPVRVTGFQFASGLFSADYCPFGYGPCAHPTEFSLEASNDEIAWTTLFSVAAFAGMRVATRSPFFDEDSAWWDGGVFVSDRLDVANDHSYRSYRLVVTGFKPDRDGNYNVSELIFYGASA
ncbi:hypothetical protein [Solidesulfovibrio sp.]